ncbi:MAG: sulfurtransferase TusA family protein [Candidatus Neomarinimicrobiota bacterium]|nr:sulfurtransferase TusA family protein [Candidatus Neomarinimicrobiota bacterium]
MTEFNIDSQLDCSGLNCPLPILKTKKAMDTLTSGQVLKMVSTDPGSMNDIAAWVKRTGDELLESIAEEGQFTFYLKKS